MHFVGEKSGRKIVQHYKEIYSQATGEKVKTVGTIWLDLPRGVAPEWAVEQARSLFTWSTRPTPGAIGGMDIPVESWCVYVDTEEWQQRFGHSDEVRIMCEELLLNSYPELIQVMPPVLTPPWPNYLDLTIQGSRTAQKVAERNLQTAEEIGIPIEKLIEFETATQNREEVVRIYEDALAAATPPEETRIAVEA